MSVDVIEFVRVDDLFDRNYVGSVIVNAGVGKYYEPVRPSEISRSACQRTIRFDQNRTRLPALAQYWE